MQNSIGIPGFLLALLVANIGATALAAETDATTDVSICRPATDAQVLYLCPDASTLSVVERLSAQPLRVDPLPSDIAGGDPIAAYGKAIFEVADRAKLTPLLFPGRPIALEKEPKPLLGGYLWTFDAKQARRWHRGMRFGKVFDTPTIAVRRGDELFELNLTRWGYMHADGIWKNLRGRFLIYDQVASSREALPPPAAFDLRAAVNELAPERIELRSLRADRAEVVIHWPDRASLPAIVIHNGARTVLLAVAERPDDVLHSVRTARDDAEVPRGIVAAAREMVREHLRFDEPRTEFGQQDGALRRAWRKAYAKRKREYEFNGDTYPVYDRQGRPYVPQVCIDFIVDAIDRYGGSWYNRKGRANRRTRGLIELRHIEGYYERSAANTVELAEQNPDMFDLVSFAKDDRIPWKRTQAFRQRLREFPGGLLEADIIVIWGKRPDNRNHYHTFYVYETDPVHRYPVTYADNAGYAQIRIIEDIMSKSPRRFIVNRLRMRPSWVKSRMEEMKRERDGARGLLPGEVLSAPAAE